MKTSVLTKHQTRTLAFKKVVTADGYVNAYVKLRYDDCCNNGHNTFSITCDIYQYGRARTDNNLIMAGCCHDFIETYIPELAHCIKWHLCSSDGPFHYVDNTIYHATAISKHQNKWFTYLKNDEFKIDALLGIFSGDDVASLQERYGKSSVVVTEYENGLQKSADLKMARSTALWPDASLEQLRDKTQLEARLPALMAEFQVFIESLDFVY